MVLESCACREITLEWISSCICEYLELEISVKLIPRWRRYQAAHVPIMEFSKMAHSIWLPPWLKTMWHTCMSCRLSNNWSSQVPLTFAHMLEKCAVFSRYILLGRTLFGINAQGICLGVCNESVKDCVSVIC